MYRYTFVSSLLQLDVLVMPWATSASLLCFLFYFHELAQADQGLLAVGDRRELKRADAFGIGHHGAFCPAFMRAR
jgi:hypothetical protein